MGPLLFTSLIDDLLFIRLDSEICDCANASTFYSCWQDLSAIVTNPESDLSRLLEWSPRNAMLANLKKFKLMFLGLNRQRGIRLNIEGSKVPATDCVKLFGIKIDIKLKFIKHVKTSCTKVNKKIGSISRFNTFISRKQALVIYNAVIPSNLDCCPLVWLFCKKCAKEEIHCTHNRVLLIQCEEHECIASGQASDFPQLAKEKTSQRILGRV